MKTTIKGLQALQIALRNRVERLPDGVAIRMYNDIHYVTIGDIAAIIEASGGMIRFDNTGIYFKTSRNQAKRLRKRLQDWVDSAIGLHQFGQGIQAAAQAGEKAGEDLRTMFAGTLKNPPTTPNYAFFPRFPPLPDPIWDAIVFRPWIDDCAFKLEIDPSLVARIREKRIGKTPNSFPPADLDRPINGYKESIDARKANEAAKDERIQQLEKDLQDRIRKHVGLSHEYAELHTEHENLQAVSWAKEAAKDKQVKELKADLEAVNLTKDGAFKLAKRVAEKGLAVRKENSTLKATNAELVRQAQAHNQEAIQLREALANMTRLRDEALGKSVRLPKEGEEIEYRNSESAPWKTCTVAVRPHGRPYAPDTFGLMYLEAENHGILWRWPAPKERTAADAKTGNDVWIYIKSPSGPRRKINTIILAVTKDHIHTSYHGEARYLRDFGTEWGFAPETAPKDAKPKTAADAKKGDRVWFILDAFKIISKIHHTTSAGAINIDCPASPGKRGLFLTHKSHFGKSWGFAD